MQELCSIWSIVTFKLNNGIFTLNINLLGPLAAAAFEQELSVEE